MRMTRNWAGAGLAAGVALALTACADATGPEALSDEILNDVALVAADATLEDLALVGASFGFGRQAVGGAGGPGMLGGHMGIGGAFSGTRSVTFFDAEGQEQTGYDPIETAEMHVEMEFEGERTRENWSATIARTRIMVISGLAGENTTRQLDGDGTEDVSRSRHLDDGTDRSYDMVGEFTYDGVVVPIPGSDPRWPLEGTITRNMHVTIVNGPDGDVDRDVIVVITFDGDETATALVNGEAVEIDLSTREGRGPLKGRLGGHQGG
jgi:hypothetical protein